MLTFFQGGHVADLNDVATGKWEIVNYINLNVRDSCIYMFSPKDTSDY